MADMHVGEGRAPRLGVGEVPRERYSLRAAVPLGFVLFV